MEKAGDVEPIVEEIQLAKALPEEYSDAHWNFRNTGTIDGHKAASELELERENEAIGDKIEFQKPVEVDRQEITLQASLHEGRDTETANSRDLSNVHSLISILLLTTIRPCLILPPISSFPSLFLAPGPSEPMFLTILPSDQKILDNKIPTPSPQRENVALLSPRLNHSPRLRKEDEEEGEVKVRRVIV